MADPIEWTDKNEDALPDYLGQARRMLNKRLQSVPNGSVFVYLRNL